VLRSWAPILRAEWTKFRTNTGNWWLLGGLIVLVIALGAVSDAVTSCAAGTCDMDPGKTCLIGVYAAQAVAAILGVQAIGAEYHTGMIRTTFTAMPHRTRVLAAKAGVLAVTVACTGLVAAQAAAWLGQLVLPGRGVTPADGLPGLSPLHEPMLRATSGSALYLALIALLSLGVGAAMREPAPAIGVVLGLLFLVPLFATALAPATWQRHLEQISPMIAGLEIQATTNLAALPISPWAGLGVLAAWSACVLALAQILLRQRDSQ
jgi:ABC-2 type transport system permease protein